MYLSLLCPGPDREWISLIRALRARLGTQQTGDLRAHDNDKMTVSYWDE